MGVMDTSVPFITDNDGTPVKHALNAFYHTPNMERLAESGVRFSQFYAQSVSSPSRISLITGQNSTRHGATNWINTNSNNRGQFGPAEWNWEGVTADAPTLPAVLREAGYKTIHVGKAHFGPIGRDGEFPDNIGFDVNIAGSAVGEPGSYFGEDGYGNIRGFKARAVQGLEKYHGTDTFLTDALTIEAKAQVEAAVKEGKPFFLHMSHYALHATDGKFPTDERYADRYRGLGYPDTAVQFGALVEGMDWSLGELVAQLNELGIAENTFIIFVGDNGSDSRLGTNVKGYTSSAPLRGMKATEYEGGVRVPFIASWATPNAKNPVQKSLSIEGGDVQCQRATIMDIYPTILNIAGTQAPANYVVDGVDIRTQMLGKYDKKRPNTVLMHFPHQHRGQYFTTFIEGDWKIIYRYEPATDKPTCELYNLATDPYETTDLASGNMAKCNEMIVKMTTQLDAEQAKFPENRAGKVFRPRTL